MQFTVKSFVALVSVYASFLLVLPPASYAKSREVTATRAGSLVALPVDPLIQQQKLTAFDGSAADIFGHTVALNGDTAIVGAYTEDNSGGTDAGAAYVFTRSGGVWTQQQKLTAADGAASDFFGFSVSVTGDTVVIGCLQANNSSGQNAGAAYVFTRSGGVWTLQQRLQPSDGALNDFFGYSVSLEGDTAVISSVADDDGREGAGSAYIFTRSGGVWTQQQKLIASGLPPVNFGHSVSLSADTVIIGAWQDSNAGGSVAGAAYIFTRSGGVWMQQQKLTASDAGAHDFFGVSVSLNGDTAVVGAHANDGAATDAGAAYVFTRSGGLWTQQQRLQPSDAAADDLFGHWVSVMADTAVVSSPFDNNGGGVDAGAAYIFTRSDGVWTQQQKLTVSDAAAGDAFGFSLASSGNTLIVCAYEDDTSGGVNAGSAYVFVPDVPNAAPVVNAGPDQHAPEDVSFNLTASFTDADIFDTHTATVNWGDGSPTQAATVTEPSGTNPGTLTAGHTYLTSGSYTVTVMVTDAANVSGSATLQVTVTEAVSARYIHNTTTQQANANFNISGSGVVGGNLSVSGSLNANGTGLTNLNAASITTGTIDNARIGLISTPNIADSAITGSQIADSAVTAGKIGSNQVVKGLNGLTDSVSLAAGPNVTITPSGNTLTIAAAGGHFIQNTTTQQAASNFNISGNGAAGGTLSANQLDATTQFNIGGSHVLSAGGTNNLFAGKGAGAGNTTGYFNAFFGDRSGYSNTTGYGNSFFGDRAGFSNTTSYGNSFFGVAAGMNNTGHANSFVGFQAGISNTTGNGNSFVGYNAGYANTIGSSNSFIGTSAGFNNTQGYNNSFLGLNAGHSNVTGNNNAFIGTAAGFHNTGGVQNSFLGVYAGYNNVTGASNSFVGYDAGYSNTTGSSNSFVGTNSGQSNTTGYGNAFVGVSAGFSNSGGYSNSFFGTNAGYNNSSGTYNTMIGVNADVGSGNLLYATAIGANATVSTSNTVMLGRSGGQETVLVPGLLRLNTLGTAGGSSLCRNAANQVAACSSSFRYKTNIMPFLFGLNLVRRLSPIRFEWKDGGMSDVGFGAEDVAVIEPLLVTYNAKGEVEGVKYDRISAVLVNAVKEQQAQIAAQQIQLKQQQGLIDGLKRLLCQQYRNADVCR